MNFRILDHVLADHTWSATGHLCIAHDAPTVPCAGPSPEAEIDSLLSRLILRSKSDRIMGRAAKRLTAHPSTPLHELARELGVTERYLLSGLRTALGVDPEGFLADLRRSRPGNRVAPPVRPAP